MANRYRKQLKKTFSPSKVKAIRRKKIESKSRKQYNMKHKMNIKREEDMPKVNKSLWQKVKEKIKTS